MKDSKWDVTGDIDWDNFSSNEKLTFIVATHDNLDEVGGCKVIVKALVDQRGRLHIVHTETVGAKFV